MASVNIADDEQRIVIRTLNDQFRKTGIGGSIFVTKGVEYLPDDTKQKIIEAVRAFDDFSDKNDPYGEHDCAAIEIDGERIFWKIDYYDRQMKNLSPDASNTDLTNRVMTIMLSSEY